MQLVVNDSIDSQQAVVDLLAVASYLVAFFNKSKSAKNLLLKLQKGKGISTPLTVMKCVEPGRYIELLMLARLIKLRVFIWDIVEHEDFSNRPPGLTPNQWELAGGLTSLLSLARILTKFTQEVPPHVGGDS